MIQHQEGPFEALAARVIQVGPKSVIGGGLLPFDRDASEIALDMICRAGTEARKETAQLVRDSGRDIDEAALADAVNDTEVLRAAAATFSTIWLADLLKGQLEPAVPKVRNSDREELLFSTVRYLSLSQIGFADAEPRLTLRPTQHNVRVQAVYSNACSGVLPQLPPME